MFPKIPGFSPILPITQVNPEASGGVQRTGENFFVTGVNAGTASVNPYAQYDIPLNNGHNGANQRMNSAGYVGYNTPRWIA